MQAELKKGEKKLVYRWTKAAMYDLSICYLLHSVL